MDHPSDLKVYVVTVNSHYVFSNLSPVHLLTLWSSNYLSNTSASAWFNFPSSSKNLVVLFTRFGSNQSACRLAYFLNFSIEFAICSISNEFYPPAKRFLVRKLKLASFNACLSPEMLIFFKFGGKRIDCYLL